MPVGLMLQSMTSAELTEWMAFYLVRHEDEEAEKAARTGQTVWRPPETE